MCIAGKLIKMRIRNLTTPERDKDYKKSCSFPYESFSWCCP